MDRRMKRTLAVMFVATLGAMVLMGAAGKPQRDIPYADQTRYSQYGMADVNHNFSFDGWTKDLVIENTGPNTVWCTSFSTIGYTPVDVAWTNYNFPVHSGDTLELTDYVADHLACKCAAGETATVNFWWTTQGGNVR